MEKYLFLFITLISFSALSQIVSGTRTETFDLSNPVQSRQIPITVSFKKTFELSKNAMVPLEHVFVFVGSGSLSIFPVCEIKFKTNDASIDTVRVVEASDWKGNEVTANYRQSAVDPRQIIQTVSFKVRLNEDIQQMLQVECHHKVLTETEDLCSEYADEDLLKFNRFACREFVRRLTFEHLIDAFNSAGIELKFQNVFNFETKILELGPKTLPRKN